MTIRQRGVSKPARKADKGSGVRTNPAVWLAIYTALGTWQGLCRVILLIAVPIVILLVAAYVFDLDVEIGPLRIARS
jgi:hypothetical protein